MSRALSISALNTVEVGATADQTKADIDALGINGVNKNWIINGDFQISQRGSYTSATALTTSSVYHLDRFKSKHNNISGTVTHKLAQTVNGKVTNTMLLTATAGSNGRVEGVQRIEATKPFVSQTITFSAWVKSNSASSRIIIHQNGANIQTSSNQHTGGGAFELLKGTVTCAANSGDLYLYAGIQAAGTGNVAIANGHYFEMAFVKVEHGSVVTDFEHHSHAEELALCQRFFFNPLYNVGTSRADYNINYLVSGGNSGWITFTIPFPVSMRAFATFSHSLTPAKFLSSGAPSNGQDKFSFYIQNQGYAGLVGNGSIANLSGGGVHHGVVGTYYVSPSATSASHILIGNGCTFHFNAEI